MEYRAIRFLHLLGFLVHGIHRSIKFVESVTDRRSWVRSLAKLATALVWRSFLLLVAPSRQALTGRPHRGADNILNGRGRGQSRFEPEGRSVPRFLSHSIRLT